MLRGFADPVLDSQRTFRGLLEAMARPGRVVALPPLVAPPPLQPATAAFCLTVLDFDTPLWLDAVAATRGVVDYVRLHCGAPIVGSPGAARFALIADARRWPALDVFDAGTDERPDLSVTLVVQVDGVRGGRGRRLGGPGIDGEIRLDVLGAPDVWDVVRANGARFPRGVDVILCASDRVAALPRTVRVEG